MSLVEIVSARKRVAMLLVLASGFCPIARAGTNFIAYVEAAGFTSGTTNLILESAARGVPFNQSAIKQGSGPAAFGPNPKVPYFTVRFAMPVPPENAKETVSGAMVGIDPAVFTHNHSPGFEILPNGDALAVYFSTPPGDAEAAPTTTFVQARLRYGAEEWDLPELFFDFKNVNDQSGLLWKDGSKIWFFGGGRGVPDSVPFKIATSTDNGASWNLSLPELERDAMDYTAQPITSAFRGPDRSIYFAMDGDGSRSFLWRSADEGVHWQQMEGRTGGRHSVIMPLDDKGNLLSIGGKNSSTNGWSPENTSTNWGASWSSSTPSPFPPLGSAQRPSMIRLADGNLFFVSDAFLIKPNRPPPEGWKYGNDPFVAISKDNGASWHIKTLPVKLPNYQRGTNGTVGYVTARQAPNGVIHILTTVTQPCLHYELNEAWVFSDASAVAPETSGGTVKKFSEKYPNGKVRSRWSARITPGGRYLLDGEETDYYEDGAKQHEVTYANGRKTGAEIFWSTDGKKLWSWEHDLKNNRSVWTQYWPNGKKKMESTWNTMPQARDLKRSFFGLVADGLASQWNEEGTLLHAYYFSNGNFGGSAVAQPATK
jgi:antitoxin component YwqK of YwqJK toxin-antitoxin module